MIRRLLRRALSAIRACLARRAEERRAIVRDSEGPARAARAQNDKEAESRGRPKWKDWAIGGAMTVAALGGLGALAAVTGVMPIKASSGHWPATRWILNFSMGRSVSTHSIGIKVPELDRPRLVLLGAGHYETGCAPCHGRPGAPLPLIPAAMTPHPPSLVENAAEWAPEELFYIVKHGVKFTGMPAWPAKNRDDEVWAMVAFLRRLPALSPAEYEALARGDVKETGAASEIDRLSPRARQEVVEHCARCHGPLGRGRENGAFPRLAGQRAEYLVNALESYASGGRPSGIMAPLAAHLDKAATQELAEFYAGLKKGGVFEPTAEQAQAASLGRKIANAGVPESKTPSCADCHGPTPARRNPAYPLLAGQHVEYLAAQLELFRDGRRGGSEFAHLMHESATRLTDEEIQAVASFYASLSSEEAAQE